MTGKSSKKDIVNLLETMERHRSEEEKEKLDFLKHMQTEKMDLLRDLVDAINVMAQKH